MKTHLLLPAIALALTSTAVLSGPGPSTGGGPQQTHSGDYAQAGMPFPDPASVRREFFGVIAEVRPEEKVIVVDDRSLGMQPLHVDSRTRISQGDKNASWNDLRNGAVVDGFCVGAPGSAYAEVINIGR